MKKTNNTTIRKNKFLRLSASGILLAMLFVFVFAGALSASFAVEKIAIEKGQLEENVAEAAGTWENGVDSFNNGFTTYNVWDKVDFGTVGGATDSRNRTLSASGDLSTFIGYDIVKCRLQHRVTDDSSGYTFTFYVKKNNSSGTTMINQSHTLNSKTTYTSDWYTSSFPTTLYFYCSSGGKLTNWSTVLDVLIEFAAKSYTITVNEQSPTTAGSPSSININGGSTLGSITRAYKTGYTLQGYYTGTNGSGTKIFNANGTVNKGTTYVDSSGRWIKNENPTVYAYWVKNTGTIIYDKNAPTGKTVTGTVSNTTVSYNTAFSLANGGYTCAGYAIIGWETDSANYTLGQSFAASATSSAPFKLTDDGQTFSITMRAVWHEIGFTFNGTNYATYNNEVLKILVDLTGSAYISEYNVPSGFTCEILYDGSSSPATTLGAHSATVTIKEGNTVRGTRTLSFTITEGDFAKKTSGVSGNWGSATNPYVIKTNEHLTNLINITNGTQAPQNSVKGVSGIAANAAVQGEYVVVDGVNVYNYANCVFELDPTETLTATGIIGKDATWAFKATFDGKNNSIALTISHTGSNYTGLFGYLNGAVIQNLKVSGSISGAAYTGGIAGYATGGSITNCQTLSSPITSVVGTGRYVAGIVGNANACNITSCTNNATITGARDTAGIVGYTAGTMTISGCTNNGNVTSSATSGSYDETGGIGGEVDNGTTITNCTNTGIIIGKICQNGGIAGWMAGQFTGTITNSGPVLGGSQVGGIAGKWIMNANCSANFTFNVNKNNPSAGEVGNGIDSTGAYGGGLFGILQGTGKTYSGAVSVTNNDVDLYKGGSVAGGIAGYMYNTTFTPSSCTVSVTCFARGYRSAAFTENSKSFPIGAYCGGIVGILHNSTLSGCNFTGGNSLNVNSYNYCGGIVAYAYGSTIIDCDSSTRVGSNGSNQWSGCSYVGGIVGCAENSTIEDCDKTPSTGTYPNVHGNTCVGGVVGGIIGSGATVVSGCSNTGIVTAAGATAGGIVGDATTTTTTTNLFHINNCYNSGAVTATTNAGGIIGYFSLSGGSGTLQIEHCASNNGTLTATNKGNFVGNFSVNAKTNNIVNYCYGLNSSYNFSGVSASNLNTSYCWNFFTGASSITAANNNKYAVLTSATVYPYVDGTELSSSNNPNWAAITSNDVNSFAVAIDVADGKYFSTRTSSATNVDNNYFTPTAVSKAWGQVVSGLANTLVKLRYAANVSGGLLYCSAQDVVFSESADHQFTYSASAQGITVTRPTASPYAITYLYTGTQADAGSTAYSSATAPTHTGSYNADVTFKISSKAVGHADIDFSIIKRIIYISNVWTDHDTNPTLENTLDRSTSNNFTYNGSAQGLASVTFVNLPSGDGTYTNKTNPNSSVIAALTASHRFTRTDHNTTDVTSATDEEYLMGYYLTAAASYNFDFYGDEDRNGTFETNYGSSVVYKYKIARMAMNDTQFAFGLANNTVGNSANAREYTHFGSTSATAYYNNGVSTLDKSLNYSVSQSIANTAHNAKPSLVYYDTTVYKKSNFKLYFTADGTSGVLLPSNGYTVYGNNDLPSVDDITPIKDVTITIEGGGNYTGTLYVRYKLMNTDFGGDYTMSSHSAPDYWGTQNNPFLITDVAHLLRLVEIVNGESEPWNSLYEYGGSSFNGDVNHSVTAVNYANAYFRLDLNITITSSGGFMPIGVDASNYFAGNFNGNSHTLTVTINNGTSGAYPNNYCAVFGYVKGTSSAYASITNLTVAGSVTGGGTHTAGLAGYTTYTTLTGNSNTATISGAGNYVGGLVGYATSGTTWTYNSGSATINQNSGSVTGSAQYIGGIVGYSSPTISSVTNTGVVTGNTVTGDQRVGGIAGYLGNSTLRKVVNNANVTASGQKVGGLVGYYNITSASGRSITNVSTGTITVIGRGYVGGWIGHLQTKCSLTIGSNNANSPTVVSVTVNSTGTGTGGSWTGGIFGYINVPNDASGAIVTFNGLRMTGNVVCTGDNYTGGILGYFNAASATCGVVFDNVAFYHIGGSAVTSISGKSYVGGLAGRVTGVSSVTNNARVNGNIYATGSYVGGFIGHFVTTTPINFTPIIRADIEDPYDNTSSRTRVKGKSYVGAIFGYVNGTGYRKESGQTDGSKIILGLTGGETNIFACVSGVSSGAAIGGAVGYASNVAIVIANDINTSYFFKGDTYNETGGAFTSTGTTKSVGGLVGVLGVNATIISGTTEAGGGVYTVKGDTTISNVSDNVGGIVGLITPRAGVYYSASSTRIGESIKLVNEGNITSTGNYVGGIAGFVGIAKDGLTVSFPVADDGLANGNMLIFEPVYAYNSSTDTYTLSSVVQNTGNIQGANYVGGLVGCVGASDTETEGARLHFENKPVSGSLGSTPYAIAVYSGDDDSKVIATASYVGGLVGAITGNYNSTLIKYAFATGTTLQGVKGVNHVGGLVGYMEGSNASVENSFFARTTDQNGVVYNSHVAGTGSYVGGLVGTMAGGKLLNSVGMGFKYDDCAATKTGVVGQKLGSAIVQDSWAIYHKAGATFNDAIDSEKGKGVIITTGSGTSIKTPTFTEVAQMVGLVTGANTLNATSASIAGGEGYISVAIGLPSVNSQLVFYDATGNDATYAISNFDAKLSSGDVVYLKLDMSKASFSICVRDIVFRDIPKITSSTTEANKKKNVADHYQTPDHLTVANSEYKASVSTATYGATYYISATTGFVYVGIEGFKTGSFDMTFTIGSQTTPYIISNQTEWNEFAKNVRGEGSVGSSLSSGSTYYNYVRSWFKLTTNSISITSGAQIAGKYENDNGNYAFRGTFDGDGHTINVSLSLGNQPRVGVFANATDATFKNLTLDGTLKSVTSTTNGDTDSDAGNYTVTTSQTTGYDLGGFVGKPFGSVTFVNCTNSINLTGYRNVGGFVGFVDNGLTVTIIDCVNEGTLRSYEMAGEYSPSSQYSAENKEIDFDGGTGGFIGCVKGNTVIDSCRNDGTIRGPQNLGGIVGRSTKTLNIYNCANTADITADSGYNTDSNEADNVTVAIQYAWSFNASGQHGSYDTLNYVGGLVGKTSGTNAALNLYASYNEGTITAYGSVAGGLVGSVGNYIPIDSGTFGGTPDHTDCGVASTIAYCYNKGLVRAGGDSNKCIQGWASFFGPVNRTVGSIAGGIVGAFGAGRISYCYNTADVIIYGGDGYAGVWIMRVGGIVAHAQPSGSNGSYLSITLDNCYNTGLVQAPATRRCAIVSTWGDNATKFGATIMGFVDAAGDDKNAILNAVTISNCYSTPLSYYNAKRDDNNKYANIGTYDDLTQMSSGRIVSLADMTAVMRSDGAIAPVGGTYESGKGWTEGGAMTGKGTSVSSRTTSSSAATLVDSSGNSIKNTSNELNPTYANAFKNGTLNGWIYVYGCLPQLAVFALGTRKGYSMLATSYGRNLDGDFVAQQAGDQFSPYIIKDGIHLMSMTALTSASVSSCYYDFNNKYVEFADGDDANSHANSNNIKNQTVLGIVMPSSATDSNAYKGVTTQTGSTYITSKGYFLFTNGAVMAAGDITSGNSSSRTSRRTAWQNKNYYYDGTNSGGSSPSNSDLFHSGATIANSQFWPISSVGRKSVFKGSLDGKGGLIRGINLTYGGTGSVNVGLFTQISGGTVKNLGVSGTITGFTYGAAASNELNVGGIAGKVGAGAVIDGCYAGYNSTYSLTITALSKNENATLALLPTGHVGGIAGLVDTAAFNYDGSTTQVASAVTTIVNCETRRATITTFKNGVGGIVGYASASKNNEGTTVNIENCTVLGATIQTTANSGSESNNAALGINAGGIIGTHDNKVILRITNCVVGDSSQVTPLGTPTNAYVKINGENSIGGIVGAAGRNLTITGSSVYGDVTIARDNKWGTVLNNEFGTSIGGLIGYTPEDADGVPNIVIGGSLVFAGNIVANIATANSGYVESIGGVAGYFGAGTRFASGARIYVVGKIASNQTNIRNIGGVVGKVANASFSGTFYSGPTMAISNADNVGGFIGTATGTCAILADNTSVHIGGQISAHQYVGGFIGYVGSTASLQIAPTTYAGVNYDSNLTITVAQQLVFTLPNSTQKTCPVTTIVASYMDVGGIIGKNEGGEGYGVLIQKGATNTVSITNAGAVSCTNTTPQETAGQVETNVGGFIGNNAGELTIASGATVSNAGNVTGKDYVGGIIGKMEQGALQGSFTNSGTVSGVNFVGGSIGYMAKGTTITASASANSVLTNSGNVFGTGAIVGGSIGAMFGTLEGNSTHRVRFVNTGNVTSLESVSGTSGAYWYNTSTNLFVDKTVTAVPNNVTTTYNAVASDYFGGSIGVLAGTAIYTNFINNGTVITAGQKSIGGSIGIIGLPAELSYYSSLHDTISYTYTHAEYASASGLTVTGAAEATALSGAAAAIEGRGGIGGVIGVIDSDVTAFSNNSFYVAGNVTAINLDNVGGTIGLVLMDNVQITDLLAHDTKITGRENVGGIIGAMKGTGGKILNSFNVTVDNANGVFGASGATYVGGIVGYADNSTVANTSYWVKGYANDELASLNINTLSTTLGKYQTISKDGIDYTYEFCSNYETPHDYDDSLSEDLTWAQFFNTTRFPLPSGYTTIEKTSGETGWYVFSKGSSFKPYTTGTAKTGWYFVYSNDMRENPNNPSSPLLINTVYSTLNVAGQTNLDYWKYIANCYAEGETRPNSGLASSIIYDAEEGYVGGGALTANSNGSKLHAVASTSTISGYYLYVAATGEGLVKHGTKNGAGDVHFFVEADKSDYFDEDANAGAGAYVGAQSENVVIYYRSIGAGKDLIYNGYQRYAPVSVSEVVYSDTELAAQSIEGYTYRVTTYVDSSDNTVSPYPVVVDTYTSDVLIYYVESGTLYKMGFIDDMEWDIKPHALEASVTPHSGSFGADGSYKGDGSTTGLSNSVNTIVVEITGIAPSDISNTGRFVEFKFSIADLKNNVTTYANAPVYYNTTNMGLAPSNFGLDNTLVLATFGNTATVTSYAGAFVTPQTDTLTSEEKANTITALSVGAAWNTYKFVFHFKNANTQGYRITVETEGTHTSFANGTNVSKTCYTMASTNGTLTINPVNLTVEAGENKSSDYTGSVHSNDFLIGKGATSSNHQWRNIGDANTILPQFGMQIIWVKKDSSKVVTDIDLSNISSSSVSATDYAIALKAGNLYHNEFVISNFKEYGSYYIHFTSTDNGNYKLDNTNFVTVSGYGNNNLLIYGISDNKIDITWSNTAAHHTKVYDKTKGDTSITFTTAANKDPFEDLSGYIAENFEFVYDSATSTTKITINRSDISWSSGSKTATINVGKLQTKGSDAGTYYIVVRGKETDNVSIECKTTGQTSYVSAGTTGSGANEKKYSRLTYTITKRPLTVTFSPASMSTFTYNTNHQGLNYVYIDNLVAGDKIGTTASTAWVTVSIKNSGADVADVIESTSYTNSNTRASIKIHNCINACSGSGKYVCTVSLNASTKNYSMSTSEIEWKINQYELSLTSMSSGASITYDGQTHIPSITVSGQSVSNGSMTYNSDTITFTFDYSVGGSSTSVIKDAGTYTIQLGGGQGSFSAKRTGTTTNTTSNYSFSGSQTATFTVNPKEISVVFKDNSGNPVGAGVTSNNALVYNGYAQGVKTAEVTGIVAGEALTGVNAARGLVFTLSNVSGTASGSGNNCLYTFGATSNVEKVDGVIKTYSVSVACTPGASNYVLSASSSTSSTWKINPLAISIPTLTGWSNPGTAGDPVAAGYYVFTGWLEQANPHKINSPTVASATIGTAKAAVNTTYNSTDDVLLTEFVGLAGSERIYFEISEENGGNRIDVGDYTAVVADFRVDGTNGANAASVKDNFTFNPAAAGLTCDYHITPAVVSVSITSPSITKTYDGNTSTTNAIPSTPSYSINYNGATEPESPLSVTLSNGTYNNKNVGTGKTVTYSASLTSGGNYAFGWSKDGENEPVVNYTTTVSANVGVINPKAVTITLNLRNYGAYKTYDGNAEYASASNTSATSMRSTKYRAGQGFNLTGLISGEATGSIVVAINYAESDESNNKARAVYNSYVNNVYDTGTTEAGTGKKIFAIGDSYYKKLVVTISGSNCGNYSYTIAGGGNSIVSNVVRPENLETLTISVFDSNDAQRAQANGQDTSHTINISINPRSATASYTNTAQSYANADNTFNTTWQAVTGTITNAVSGDGVSIKVFNGWRTDNHTDSGAATVTNGKRYESYTTIRGRAGSLDLEAKLAVTGTGKELNYTLRQQPTLVIGYFVVKDGYYEVGSMAGLILASYYYKMNFVDPDATGSGVGTVSTVNTWHRLTTGNVYDTGTGYPSTITISGATVPVTSWDDYFTKFATAYNENENNISHDIVVEHRTDYSEESGGEYGYWALEKGDTTSYLKFLQVNDISGVLSSSDISILAGQFGEDWSTFVPNFLTTTKGNVVTVVNSIFGNEGGVPFIGEYDGAGHTIDSVNIMGYATSPTAATYNVGMFASVGYGLVSVGSGTVQGNGIVTGVNLRNWNIVFSDYNAISGNVLNVGGIIGYSKQSTTLEDSSFHGVITVSSSNGTINVGGLIGQYNGEGVTAITIIDGAMALGNIYINEKTVNAGGIVGLMTYADGFKVNNVVSMTGIFSKATTNSIGGLIGKALLAGGETYTSALTTSDGKENAYVTDSVVNMKTGAVVNKQVGNNDNVAGVSYSTLIAYSESGFVAGKYSGSGHTTTAKKYDVIDDRTVAMGALYMSPRLVDVIKVYVLLYGNPLSTTTIGETAGVPVYTMSATSELVGSALGTDSSKITINNQQQVAYLREFRFASFNLARDIDMYNNFAISPVAGSFFGSVTANGHTINLRGSAQAKMFQVELANHALPISIDV